MLDRLLCASRALCGLYVLRRRGGMREGRAGFDVGSRGVRVPKGNRHPRHRRTQYRWRLGRRCRNVKKVLGDWWGVVRVSGV